MPPHTAQPAFDLALRDALGHRGLPLARVRARLDAAGLPVAISTLSQWQHGHRLPRSERSLAVVDELERILQVPVGSLRRAAQQETGPVGHRPVVGYGDAFTGLVHQLQDTSYGALLPLGVHDRVTVDAAGAVARRATTMTMRAERPTDRHVVAHGIDPGGDVAQVSFVAGPGCRLGRVLRDSDAGVVAAELLLDRRLSPGDTAVFDMEVRDAGASRSHDYYRWTEHEIALLVLETTFTGTLPARVEEFTRPRSDEPDTSATELALSRGDRVHLVRQPAPRGLHGLRWTWPGA